MHKVLLLISFIMCSFSCLCAEEDHYIRNNRHNQVKVEEVETTVFKTSWGMYFFREDDTLYRLEEMVHSDLCPCVRWGLPIPHYKPAFSGIDQESVEVKAKIWKGDDGSIFIEVGHCWEVTLYSTHVYNP